MGKVFRQSSRESKILSRIESNREYQRRQAQQQIPQCLDPLANALAQKLVENHLVETVSKNSLEEEFRSILDTLARADDFDIDYQIAPMRRLVANPNVISLYLTAWTVEKLLKHKDVVDIYGDDLEIYSCIQQQVGRFLP